MNIKNNFELKYIFNNDVGDIINNRTSIFSMAVIWFGVAISVSEIEAGISIASFSSLNNLWLPLVLGHLLGGVLLYFVGLIGAKVRLNAMETTTSAFGTIGSKFFATLNVLQLIAWVAVLNAQGAIALAGLNFPLSFPLICIVLAILVAIWVYVGLQRSANVTTIVMIILTLLLVVLSVKLFGLNTIDMYSIPAAANSKLLSFWNIFEISIAMPISWLPVISDYTKDAKEPMKATAIAAIAYTVASLWMYFIGVEIVGLGLNYTIAQSILHVGLGTVGIGVLVLSTVTTNFLATNSAGESAKAIYHKINPKIAGVIVSALSAILAISGIMDHYINFLYLIASVFAPMAAVMLVSFYLDYTKEDMAKIRYWNIFAWFAGFMTYQVASYMDSIFLGPTLLSIIVSFVLAYLPVLIRKKDADKTM